LLKFHNFFYSLFSESKNLYIFIILINICLIIDVAIATIPDFIQQYIVSPLGISTFFFIVAVSIFGQLYLQKFAEKDNNELLSKSKYLSTLSKINRIACYVLIGNLISIIVSIGIFSTYSIINLLIGNNISCFIGSFMLGSLGIKFIIWYMARRNSLIILFYGLGFLFFAFSIFIILMSDNLLLLDKPILLTPDIPISYPDIENNIFGFFTKYTVYLHTISFILLLVASYLLLSQYSDKINKYKLIMALIIVFIIYMTSTLNSFNILEIPLYDKNLFYYYIFQSLKTTLEGIIYGYSFWKVANKLDIHNPIRKYLIISANGFILIYFITQSTVIASAYPPYGIPSLSFIIISIYLLNFGIYSSAVSLSHNIHLRQTIRTLTSQKASLFGNIGQAQMTSEMQKVVTDLKGIVEKEEEELKEKTGIESNITKETVKDYMEQVLQELQASKKKRINTNSCL